MITVFCIQKTKIKKKETGNGPFFKKNHELKGKSVQNELRTNNNNSNNNLW